MIPEISPGDIVTLKSGSPKMTVESVYANRANCTFYSVELHQFVVLHAQTCALDKVL